MVEPRLSRIVVCCARAAYGAAARMATEAARARSGFISFFPWLTGLSLLCRSGPVLGLVIPRQTFVVAGHETPSLLLDYVDDGAGRGPEPTIAPAARAESPRGILRRFLP